MGIQVPYVKFVERDFINNCKKYAQNVKKIGKLHYYLQCKIYYKYSFWFSYPILEKEIVLRKVTKDH